MYDTLPKDYEDAGVGSIPVLPPQGPTVPLYSNLYKAFHLCPLKSVKVVMVGQDPYHGLAQADGLAFSCTRRPMPPSLRNILKELRNDVGVDNLTGDLSGWAKEGVLLLNTALTTKFGYPGKHIDLWKPFTESVFKVLNTGRPKVFVLIGEKARAWRPNIDDVNHFVIEVGHPSPLNRTKPFLGCRMFSKINAALKVLDEKPINWNV